MKVGLISFHNAYNYGACLQAYALQEAVAGFGASCEYIDYINKRRADGYSMSARFINALRRGNAKEAVKSVIGAPFVWSRGRKFKAFYANHLKTTNQVFHSCEEAALLEKEYDKFIVGSDQVWNADHNGTDPAYFLSFVNDRCKKISYSSSFGMDAIPPDLYKWYEDGINGIGCISTREEAGQRIISELSGRKAHLVLDPVFLLEPEQWLRFVDNERSIRNYTFYYLNAPFDLGDIKRVTGLTDSEQHVLSSSVNIRDFIKKGRKVTFSLSPEDFLSEIYNAELVVTTSFHCLAFSIIFRKKFIAILSGDKGRDERLLNLLKITGLENRIFTRDMTIEQVEQDIDYDKVEHRLNIFKKYSRDYLSLSLFHSAQEVDKLKEPKPEINQSSLFKICEDDKCMGCGACVMRCPAKAIRMLEDVEGFLRPSINLATCTNCNTCVRICPANDKTDSYNKQSYYALKSLDSIREVSSSGGAFRVLAQSVIEQNGVVISSEMHTGWRIEHSIAHDMEEIERQGHTYYVQGKAYDQFPVAEKILNNGEKVLFVGTPCQVAGLKKYLKKDYQNLYTCDIVCHGVPSPRAFQSYIQYLQSRGELTELNHRDKSVGWKGYCTSIVIDGRKEKNPGWLKAYNVMFSHGLINRLSCYSCPYANYNRPSDITIGDWWGAEKYRKEFVDKLGVSLVIVNSEKGQRMLQTVSNNIELVELKKEETIQNSLLKPQKKPVKRMACLIMINKSYEEAAKKYGEWNIKGYCKEYLRRILMRISGL